MRPRDTSYRLVTTLPAYQRCHALLKAQGLDDGALSYPTVCALRDDDVIGLLSTIASQEAIIAGPLVVKTSHPVIVALRLIESYENVLRHVGVRQYVFGVDPQASGAWLRLLVKAGVQPYYRDDTAVWFKRTIAVRRRAKPSGAKRVRFPEPSSQERELHQMQLESLRESRAPAQKPCAQQDCWPHFCTGRRASRPGWKAGESSALTRCRPQARRPSSILKHNSWSAAARPYGGNWGSIPRWSAAWPSSRR